MPNLKLDPAPRWAAVLACAALAASLQGCGDSNEQANAASSQGQDPIAPASTDAFIAYVSELAARLPDNEEPVDIDGITATKPENTEPVPVN